MAEIRRNVSVFQAKRELSSPSRKLNYRLLFLSFIFFVFASVFAPAPAAYAADGTLTQDSLGYYLIEDEADLIAFRNIVNEAKGKGDMDARLTADITLAGSGGFNAGRTPIGSGDSNPYTGTFDGGGYTISGLNISNDDYIYFGLFGYIGSGAIVQNLVLSGPTVASSGVNVGTIAGYSAGTIQNCSVTTTGDVGSVTSTDTNWTMICFIGGIVGNNDGSVKNCMSSVAVNYSYSSDYDRYAGGIVGSNFGNSSSVTNCLFTGEITDENGDYTTAGGVVGRNSSTGKVTNCAYVENGNYSDDAGSTAIEDSAIADDIVLTLSASIDPQTIYLPEGAKNLEVTFYTSPTDLDDTSAVATLSAAESGDEEIATAEVVEGTIRVTPVAEGETTLTVKVEFTPTDFSNLGSYVTSATELTFTLPLTVAENRVELTAISLTEEVTLKAYDATTITVTTEPRHASIDSITWKSDNENVATVWSFSSTSRDGIVTGVSEGTANINVTVKDEFGTEYTAACKVTVTAADADTPESSSGGSGGGCNAGIGALALLALIPFALRRKR